MSNAHNIEDMEAQVKEIKAEQTRCRHRTLEKLAKLYETLNNNEKNSAEQAAIAVPEPVVQV